MSMRMEFRMAMTDTPTSAKTAHHMLATPNADRTSTRNFTARAKTMFSRTMRNVLRAMRTATGTCSDRRP